MTSIETFTHPLHLKYWNDWTKWRLCYDGGDEFLDRYLTKFSNRETDEDYKRRKSLSPITTFAKSAIKDVRNSIFQRMAGISRMGGSPGYMSAVKGERQGVDNRGSSMTSFIGKEILDELLVMGGAGVYIDAPQTSGQTLLTSQQHKAYLYRYRIEDILNWVKNDPENPNEFQSLLLRENEEVFDDKYGMPTGFRTRFRRVWINEETGYVNVQFINQDGEESLPIELKLKKIPFVYFDLKDSLIKDVANHQIALLNLWSSNVYYAIQSGFPIYVEQRDPHSAGDHLKRTATDGSATTGGQGASEREITVGVAKGRAYDLGAERPGFIHPSSEPLESAIKLCDQLKKDTRELINLAVVNLGVQASAESKNMDNSGLEAGLSYIGLVLEAGEREIARHWAAYEQATESKRQVATVSYPERWSLKSDKERIEDASEMHAVIGKLPSRSAKKQTSKLLIEALLGRKVSTETLQTIFAEIDQANYVTSDPEIIKMAKEQGLLGAETGAVALGFDAEEAEIAKEEHVDRLKTIAMSQTSGIQGVADTQANASEENREIQDESRDDDERETPEPTRGNSRIAQDD